MTDARRAVLVLTGIVAAVWAFTTAATQPAIQAGQEPARPVAASLPARVPNLIEVVHTRHHRPAYVLNGRAFLVTGQAGYHGDGGGWWAASVYVDGLERYPVIELYLADLDDQSATPEVLRSRVAAWARGLQAVVAAPPRGDVLTWLPVDEAGGVIDPTAWGWID